MVVLLYFIIGIATVALITFGMYLIDKKVIGRKKLLILVSGINFLLMSFASIFKYEFIAVFVMMVIISSLQTVAVGIMYPLTA